MTRITNWKRARVTSSLGIWWMRRKMPQLNSSIKEHVRILCRWQEMSERIDISGDLFVWIYLICSKIEPGQTCWNGVKDRAPGCRHMLNKEPASKETSQPHEGWRSASWIDTSPVCSPNRVVSSLTGASNQDSWGFFITIQLERASDFQWGASPINSIWKENVVRMGRSWGGQEGTLSSQPWSPGWVVTAYH